MGTHHILVPFLLVVFCIASFSSSSSSSRTSELNLLNGQHLRVPIINYPPSFSVVQGPDGKLVPIGYSANILIWIAQRFNMSFSFIQPNQSDIDQYGQIQAAINLLINDEIDIIAFTLGIDLKRFRSVEFSVPVSVNQFSILQPWPEEESKITASIKPFQPLVWLGLGISVLVLVLVTSVIAHYDPIRSGNNSTGNGVLTENFSQHLIYVVAVMTGKSSQPPYQLRYFLLTGLWCLMMVIMVNAYMSTLKAYTTVPKLKPIVNSFEELIDRNDFKLTLEANAVLTTTIMDATGGTYKVLGDYMRANPQYLYKESKHMIGLTNVLEHGCAFPMAVSYIKVLIGMDIRRNGVCRMTFSKPLSLSQSYSFALPKINPRNELINIALLHLIENGLLEHWAHEIAGNQVANQCEMTEWKPTGKAKILTLLDIYSAFIILGIGYTVSVIAFLAEIVFHSWKVRLGSEAEVRSRTGDIAEP